MTGKKIQVKKFVFKVNEPYDLPAHWIPFQAREEQPVHNAPFPPQVEIWAYRNGNT